MEQLDISIGTIIKVIVSGVSIYIISPTLLVIRDLLLQKVIEKWIFTTSLSFQIKLCESSRWLLNNKYQHERTVKYPLSSGKVTYEINGKEVSSDDYKNYEKWLMYHQKLFHYLDAKINMRHNLILYLIKHYKQDELKSPIPKLREEAYQHAEAEAKQAEAEAKQNA